MSPEDLAAFSARGFVLLRSLATPARVSELREIALTHLAGNIGPAEYEADLHYPGAPASREAPGGATTRRLLQACARHPAFQDWALSPEVATPLHQLIGLEPMVSQVHHNCIMTKQPRYSSLTGWHQDIRYWSFGRPELISVWLALGREFPDNGCLSFLPGTHLLEVERERLDDGLFLREEVPQNQALFSQRVTSSLEPGDAVFFPLPNLPCGRKQPQRRGQALAGVHLPRRGQPSAAGHALGCSAFGCGVTAPRRSRAAGLSSAAGVVGLLALWLPLPVNAEPTRLHHYTVSIDSALSTIRVRACFAGKTPRRLMAESLDAAGALETAGLEGAKKSFEPNGAELRLGPLPDNACIAYGVNLAQFRGGHEHGGSPTRYVGGDLITDLGMWFWRPDTLEVDEDMEVSFDLPPGIAASAPWQAVDAPDGRRSYRVGHGPYDWPAAVAFGHFTERIVEAPGVRLHVAILDGRPKVDEAQIAAWLQRAAAAVTTLYGRFPVPSAQVLVIPGARGNEPVPWAYVLRGGGPAAHLYINQRRSADEFNADWSVVHELSHLLLPYVQSEDAWLSEGVASYYQNVLRARAGTIGPQEAWQRMHGGFKRGMENMSGVTLAGATERMYRNGAFLRVYWEGAAIMLLADQRLRARTQGRQSLDTALDQLQRCCLSSEIGWRGHDLFLKLDQLTATTVFSELYEQHVASDTFPDIAEAYRLLGLRVTADGDVVMLDDAPQRADRDAIMSAAGNPRATEGLAAPGAEPGRTGTLPPTNDHN